jgi:hypothetical protein
LLLSQSTDHCIFLYLPATLASAFTPLQTDLLTEQLTTSPVMVHTPYFTLTSSPTPSSYEERSLSPVIFASHSPFYTPSSELQIIGSGTHSNPICLDDADPSPPPHSNPNPPLPTPSHSHSNRSSQSSSSYHFKPYWRYTHTYTFRHEVIHQQAVTND